MQARLSPVVQFLRRLADDEPGDGQLLERFIHLRDEEAFAALVRRYGSLVLGVSLRVLGQEQDAEDVFQAAFLVLAQNAGSIRKRSSVGSWLHGVATRLAFRARARAARRRERGGALMDIPADQGVPEIEWRDLRPVLDREINALPEKYRQAFVLCHLLDKTNEQAARELGCPVGTVLSRLSRARQILRGRLTRCGVSASIGLMTTLLAREASARIVPSTWIAQTMKAAMAIAAGKEALAGLASATALALAEGVSRTMSYTRVHILAALLLLGGMVGTGVYSQQGPGNLKGDDPFQELQRPDSPTTARKGQEKPFSDPNKEAIRLQNKLLEEDIEDEKVKLEALQKKLERLKRSKVKPDSAEDPELTALRGENRRLQRTLARLQDDVRALTEEVEPYVAALRRGAGDKGSFSGQKGYSGNFQKR